MMFRCGFVMLRMFMTTFINFLHCYSPYADDVGTEIFNLFVYFVITLSTWVDFAFWYAARRLPFVVEAFMFFFGVTVLAYNAIINLQFFMYYEDLEVAKIGIVKSHMCFLTVLIYGVNFFYVAANYITTLQLTQMRNNFPPPVMVMTISTETLSPANLHVERINENACERNI